MLCTESQPTLTTVTCTAAGAIWTSEMPVKLAEHLPNVNQTTRDQLFGSITDVMALPFGDPTREGVIAGTSWSPSRCGSGLSLTCGS